MAVLLVLNLPLFVGGTAPDLAFSTAAVRVGEWWRVLTHPLVHVSWYHFTLDAIAFACAYSELAGYRVWQRISFVASAGFGALIAALLSSPHIASHGLCGLSGIDHGLTAVVGLELWRSTRDRTIRMAGLVCLLGVIGKCLIEVWTGSILFASWHLGSLGTPIAECHAGGVLGAILAWCCFRWFFRRSGGNSRLHPAGRIR